MLPKRFLPLLVLAGLLILALPLRALADCGEDCAKGCGSETGKAYEDCMVKCLQDCQKNDPPPTVPVSPPAPVEKPKK